MRYGVGLIFCFLFALTSQAQRVATVCGEYRYTVPGEIPLNRALSIAICFARFRGISPGTV